MNVSAPVMRSPARLDRVDDDVVGEDLTEPLPLLGVEHAEVPRLELLDRLDVPHGVRNLLVRPQAGVGPGQRVVAACEAARWGSGSGQPLGHPTPGAGARTAITCPVRAVITSAT